MLRLLDLVLVAWGGGIDALHGTDRRGVAVEHLLERQRDFTHRRLGAGRIDSSGEQVALAGARHLGELAEIALRLALVALGLQALQLLDLGSAHGGIVDFQDVDLGVTLDLVLVDADHRLLARVDAGLRAGGCFLDARLRDAGLDGLGHAAHRLDLLDVRPGLLGQILRQPLDEIAAAPWVDHIGCAGFLLQEQLRVARDAGREVGGQRQRLVQRVGVQRLRAALGRRHRLDAGACDVVEHVLRGKAPAAGLRMGAQVERAFVLRVEALDELGPDHACGAHLSDFHEEVHADGPEEGEARRELVDGHAGIHTGLGIFEAVGQRIGEFQIRRRACFLHVIAGDRDRVELRHLLGGVAEDVGHDLHRCAGRVDEGVANHELLEDVVLDGAGELLRRNALFLTRHDVERHDRQHGAVHGHRHRHLVERDAVEQGAHVIDRVDGHTGHPDVARHARVVRVIAAVRGEIECDGQAHLPRREVAAVEGVGILRRGEARVLADGPGLRGVHGGVGAAQIGQRSGPCVQEVDALHVLGAVVALDVQAFRRQPVLRGAAVDRRSCERDFREIRDAAHHRASVSGANSSRSG